MKDIIRFFFSFLLLLACIINNNNVRAQDDLDCHDNLNDIYQMEQIGNVNVNRKYILCPGTDYYPGQINDAGSGFVDDQLPLILRSRATVQCGDDGSSQNRCTIHGTGAFGALIGPEYFPQDETSINIKIIGITFTEFVDTTGRQIAISFRTPLGRLLLEDCIFDYVQAINPFEFTQILVSDDEFGFVDSRSANGGGGRYLEGREEDEEDDDDVPTVIQSKKEFYSKYSKEETDKMLKDIQRTFNKEMFDDIFNNRKNKNNESVTKTNNNDDEGGRSRALATTTTTASNTNNNNYEKRRKLQKGRRFNVVIKDCVFKEIYYPSPAYNQRGLAILHFSAVDPNNYLDNSIDDTTMNVQILQTRFDVVDESYQDDEETTHRSVIDFWSGGRLTLTDICFRGVDQSTNGPSSFILSHIQANVVMSPETIYIEENSVNFGPGDEPVCPVLSFVDATTTEDGRNAYGFQGCYELPADGSSSYGERCYDQPPPPVAAPPVDAGAGMFGCFTSHNYVQVEDGRRRVRMDQLKLGDNVLVSHQGGEKYESIYSFAHYHPTQVFDNLFVKLFPSKMELSSQHLIYLQGKNVPIPAGTIQIGDVLSSGQVITGKDYITKQTTKGIYAPLTPSGTIIVNNELVSTFIALQDNTSEFHIFGMNTGLSHHWLSHIFELPYRMYCSLLGICMEEETYTSDGISTRLSGLPFQFYLWLNNNNNSGSSAVITNSMITTTAALTTMTAVVVASLRSATSSK